MSSTSKAEIKYLQEVIANYKRLNEELREEVGQLKCAVQAKGNADELNRLLDIRKSVQLGLEHMLSRMERGLRVDYKEGQMPKQPFITHEAIRFVVGESM